MSLADALNTAAQQRRRPVCSVALIIEALPDEDAATLREALAGKRESTVIAEALKSEGHAISDFTLNRHRRGKCSCRDAS